MNDNMKFLPVAEAAYQVSTCGRFVWSSASDRFLKVDRDGFVMVRIAKRKERWATKDLLELAQAPPRPKMTTCWIKIISQSAIIMALAITGAATVATVVCGSSAQKTLGDFLFPLPARGHALGVFMTKFQKSMSQQRE